MATREAGTVIIWQRKQMICLGKMNGDMFFEVGHIAAENRIGMFLSKKLEGNGCCVGN